MLFVTVSPKQAAHYNYMCKKLSHMVNRMSSARKTLENFANTSFDKPLAKSVYLLASESLQCENEIRSHIDSLNCTTYEEQPLEFNKNKHLDAMINLEMICNFFEEVYMSSYKKLLSDKKFANSIRDLLQNHIQLFRSSLTQLRLFHDVKNAVN